MRSAVALVRRLTSALNAITTALCGVLMIALVVVVLLQVLYRYVLHEPLIWTEEAARHLLVWVAVLAGGLVFDQGLNPRVELIDRFARGAAGEKLSTAINVVILLFLIAFAWISLDVAMTYLHYRTLALEISQSVPRLAFPVAACLIAANVLTRLLSRREASHTNASEGVSL